MSSVPRSQYDDLQKRHENMRKSREREQRRASKLEEQIKQQAAVIERMREALRIVRFCTPPAEREIVRRAYEIQPCPEVLNKVRADAVAEYLRKNQEDMPDFTNIRFDEQGEA